jgi:hypothetical protein
MTKRSPFKTSPGIIRRAVKLCIRFPLPPQNVKEILRKRGTEISNSRFAPKHNFRSVPS